MPKQLKKLEGEANQQVSYQFMVPAWLKNAAIEAARAEGKSLADWSRDWLRAALDAAQEEHRPPRRR